MTNNQQPLTPSPVHLDLIMLAMTWGTVALVYSLGVVPPEWRIYALTGATIITAVIAVKLSFLRGRLLPAVLLLIAAVILGWASWRGYPTGWPALVALGLANVCGVAYQASPMRGRA